MRTSLPCEGFRKQTVDILSTLGRHFPYHSFVFSADTDNIFFHLCSESKLSTFCRHSVDIFPIIPLYFLRTLSTHFFSFVLGKQTVDILSTLGRHFPYHSFVFSADTDNIFFICARKANCRHFVDTRSTFSLSFLCIFCGHCQYFFSFVLGKQTVDILSTLGRHFPYHSFVFSADTDNIFFICARKANCRHFVDTRSTFSLSFLCIFCGHCQYFFSFVLGKQTVDILSTLGRHFPYHSFVFSADTDNIFFHLCSESKLSTFCRHSVDIFPIIPLYFLRTLTIFFSFVLGKQTVDILSTLGRHFPYHSFVFSADTDNIFFHLCSESKLSTFCRHSVDIFPIIPLYFLRTLSIFFFICARKANCRHFVDTRSTFSLSFLCIFCGHCQHFLFGCSYGSGQGA